MNSPRTPGQRAGLTTQQVVDAARELLTQHGPEGLSMRAVARALDVSPNALYSHVDSKTAMIDQVLDDVLAQVVTPDLEVVDPLEGLHLLMTSTYEVLLDHSELVSLYLSRQGARGMHAQRLGQTMLTLLDRAGVTGPAATEALRVLIVYAIGFAAFTTAADVPVGPPSAGEDERDGNFRAGLRWLLAGLSRPAGMDG
ncbi:MAG: TetR/AcrR family transcriptional regulator [Euzebya sp.]